MSKSISKCLNLILCTLCLTMANVAAADPLSQLMTTWVGLEGQRDRLITDWNEREQELRQQLDLLQKEEASLQSLIDGVNDASYDVDERRLALIERQRALELEQQALSETLEWALVQLEILAARLPDPLKGQWRDKLQDLKVSERTLSEKLERVLSLTKAAENFEQRIALNRTTMQLPIAPETSKQIVVTQFYVGLSQGWYVSTEGTYFGYGRSTDTGWQWYHSVRSSDETLLSSINAKRLLEVIDMVENPTLADYLSLPIVISRSDNNE